MDLAAYRAAHGISQQQIAERLGLRSKGHIANIENGHEKAGFRFALQIEALSDGQVPALSLLAQEDADLLRAAILRAGGKIPVEAEPA